MGLVVQRHHGWTTEKGMGSSWYLRVPCQSASWEDSREEERKQLDLESNANSFRSFGWEVQYCSQHYLVVEEETGLINWNQVGQQLQDWYKRRGKPELEGSGDNTVDRLWWHGKSSRPFWGIHRKVVQAGNSAWWTRDDGRKTKVQHLGKREKNTTKPGDIKCFKY